MHALKVAAKKALVKEELTVKAPSDVGSDDVVFIPSSSASINNSQRQSARDALHHMEHAYVEMVKKIQDHANAKQDTEWLGTVQDRLDMVCGLFGTFCIRGLH